MKGGEPKTNNLIHLQNFEKGAERKSMFFQKKKKCYSGEIIMQTFFIGSKIFIFAYQQVGSNTNKDQQPPPDGAALLATRAHELLLPPLLF